MINRHEAAVANYNLYWKPYQLIGLDGTSPQADHDYAINVAGAEAYRDEANFSAESYAASAASYEQSRTYTHVVNQAALDLQAAIADKQYAIDEATADQTYSIGLLNEDPQEPLDTSVNDEHRVDLATANFNHVKGVEDDKLLFEQQEDLSRKSYSVALAIAARNQDNSLAAIERSVDRQEADYQFALDTAYAQAEQTQWKIESAIDSDSLAVAQADVVWQSAQESASVAAAQAIDAALTTTVDGQPHHLPWAQFLVAQAQAHKQWWSGLGAGLPTLPPAYSGAAQYLSWINSRIADENVWRQNVYQAQGQELLAQRSAQRDETKLDADATKQEQDTIALAKFSYVADLTTGLALAAQTYLDTLAAANHYLAVNTADLSLAELESEDPDEFDIEEQLADLQSAYNSTVTTTTTAYTLLDVETTFGRADTEAQATHVSAVALATNQRLREQTDIAAEFGFTQADATLYAQRTLALDLDDRTNEIGLSISLSAAASDLATNSTNPFAADYAASQLAASDYEAVVAPAEEANLDSFALAGVGLNADGTPTGGGELGIALQFVNAAVDKFDAIEAADIFDADQDLATAEAAAQITADENGAQPPIQENPDQQIGKPNSEISSTVVQSASSLSLLGTARAAIVALLGVGFNVAHYLVTSHAAMGDADDDEPSPDDHPKVTSDDGSIDEALTPKAEELAGGKDPIIVLAQTGGLLDPSDPASAERYLAIATYQIYSGRDKPLPLRTATTDPADVEADAKLRKMLGFPPAPKPQAEPPQQPKRYPDEIVDPNTGLPFFVRLRPEPRQYTDAELDAPRNAMMMKVAEWEVKKGIAAGQQIPMTERHIIAIGGQQVFRDIPIRPSATPSFVADLLAGLNQKGMSTQFAGHDPTKAGAYSDLLPLTTREFFKGGSAEFKLAAIKRYRELKLAERDPLGAENINEVLDTLQIGLDILGMIPVVGKAFDAASGLVSAARGDVLGASLTFAALLTTVGGAAAMAVIVRRTADAVETAADTVKVAGAAADLVHDVRAVADVSAIEGRVFDASNRVLLNIDDALRARYATREQVIETLMRESNLSRDAAENVVAQAQEAGLRTRAAIRSITPGEFEKLAFGHAPNKQTFIFPWSDGRALTRVVDDWDGATIREASLLDWAHLNLDDVHSEDFKRFSDKLKQAAEDGWLLKNERDVKEVIWYGTSPLPETGRASELTRLLRDNNIEYRIVEIPR